MSPPGTFITAFQNEEDGVGADVYSDPRGVVVYVHDIEAEEIIGIRVFRAKADDLFPSDVKDRALAYARKVVG